MQRLLLAPFLVILLTLITCSGATPAPEGAETPAPTRAAALASTKTPAQGPTAAPATPLPSTAAPEPASTPGPAATSTQPLAQTGSTWRGITVAPEHRCSHYDSDDYPYSPSVEPRIVDRLGGIYGPYTGTWFGSIRETDIEHIVARSEAHDSGLCAASPATKSRFSSDLLNLTLSAPGVNRHQKSANDVAE